MQINPIINVRQNYNYANYNKPKYSGFHSKISFCAQDEYFDYETRLKQKLDARSGWQKFWGMGKKKAKYETNLELIGFNLSHNANQKRMEQSIKDKELLLAQKQEMIR